MEAGEISAIGRSKQSQTLFKEAHPRRDSTARWPVSTNSVVYLYPVLCRHLSSISYRSSVAGVLYKDIWPILSLSYSPTYVACVSMRGLPILTDRARIPCRRSDSIGLIPILSEVLLAQTPHSRGCAPSNKIIVSFLCFLPCCIEVV